MRKPGILFFVWGMVFAANVYAGTCFEGNCIIDSADKTPISYSEYGKGEVLLVFVHGWSCDSRYWREQVPYFSRRYKVVTLDLAGHGHSGQQRDNYSMTSFGEDVKAVVDAVGAKKVILIGHSMGGTVVAQAAVLMPDRVIGIVGIDTLENVESPMTQQQFNEVIGPFTVNFRGEVSKFVKGMFLEGADQDLVDWVAQDMTSAPPQIALSAFRSLFGNFISGEETKLFDRITIPVHCINSHLWPTDEAANRRHIRSYSVKYMDGVGHFLMLEKPLEFNRSLDETVRRIIASGKKAGIRK